MCIRDSPGIGIEKATDYFKKYSKLYNEGSLVKSLNHPTEIRLRNVESFRSIEKDEGLAVLLKSLFEGNIGMDYKRILFKNKDNRNNVVLHQDTGYQIGSGESYSLFIALSQCHTNNGGIQLIPGTHKLGYLGDVGELNRDVLPKELPDFDPQLDVGDILVMNSALWHYSNYNIEGSDRVYVEIHVVPGESPYCQVLLLGEECSQWKVGLNFDEREMDDFFVSSRSNKLKEAYEKLEFHKG